MEAAGHYNRANAVIFWQKFHLKLACQPRIGDNLGWMVAPGDPNFRELHVPNRTTTTGNLGWMTGRGSIGRWVVAAVLVANPCTTVPTFAGIEIPGTEIPGSDISGSEIFGSGERGLYGLAPANRSEEFLAAIQASETLGDELKAQIVERYQSLTGSGATQAEAVTDCLQMAYPAYRTAMTALESDDLVSAWQGLESLLDHTDRFLAVDAAFFLGRSYLLAGQNERAIEPLQRLMAEPGPAAALRGGETLYYLGTAQAGALQIEPAMEHLIRFLQVESGAPDRLKQGAYNQLLRLEQSRKTPLADAELRMSFSERRLGQAMPDGDTQAEQSKVVDILSQLIEDAEKKESSGSSKNSKDKNDKKPGEGDPKPGENPGQDQKPQQGNGQSSGQSSQSNGSATRQAFDNGPLSIWSQLRERERDPANSAVKEQLPPEYRKLIERYFREMSEGSQGP